MGVVGRGWWSTGKAAPDCRVEGGVKWTVNEYFNKKILMFRTQKSLIIDRYKEKLDK
jgi:hypothetical protein